MCVDRVAAEPVEKLRVQSVCVLGVHFGRDGKLRGHEGGPDRQRSDQRDQDHVADVAEVKKAVCRPNRAERSEPDFRTDQDDRADGGQEGCELARG